MVTVKELENFKEYGRVLSISNGVICALVTVDVGPRIIGFGFEGGQNIMNDDRSGFGSMTDEKYEAFFGEGKRWENFGGHRIWLSPESYPETYYPDCDKVDYKKTENGAIFTPKAEVENSVAKCLEIKMDPDDSNMQVIMHAKNIGNKALSFAIWGLSVSAKGGTAVIPMNTNNTGLLHNRVIAVWPYTDMSDDRIYWGKKYVTVRQDVNAENPLKLGFDLNGGTVYYVLGDDIFCKSYDVHHPKGIYPDGGVSFETYTNNTFIELESLSELKTVAPDETISHTERWSLCKKPCEVNLKDDASIDELLTKI